MKGVDYSWGRPNLEALRAAGFEFAVRYLSYESPPPGKVLTATEARAISAAGLGVVLVWEWQTIDALGGYAAGVQHAEVAAGQARTIGAPADVVIYFAVDFDPHPTQWSLIRAYFEGVCSVIPYRRVGVYGGIRTIAFCHDHSLAAWFWQTYAWSGGAWHPAAHARQVRNGVTIAGATVDLNETTVDHIGQFRFTGPDGSAEMIGGSTLSEQDARHAALLAVVGNTEVGIEGFDGQDQLLNWSRRAVEGRLTAEIRAAGGPRTVSLSEGDRDEIVEQLRLELRATLEPVRELLSLGKALADSVLGKLGG